MRDGSGECALIAAPGRCYEPEALRAAAAVGRRGAALYAALGANWGIGDFADLERVVRLCAPHGASFIGLNPLHALFPSNPWHFSPYSPSTRHFLNVLYIAVTRHAEFAECVEARGRVAAPEFERELARLRSTENVDYPGVARAKLPVLHTLFEQFRRGISARRPRGRASVIIAANEASRCGCTRCTMRSTLTAPQDPERYWGWPVWPEGAA